MIFLSNQTVFIHFANPPTFSCGHYYKDGAMRRSTLFGLFGFFALLLALTADLSAAYQEPPFKLETGWLPEHETFLIWYAKQKGWDKQEGLDIVLNRFDSGKDLIGNADKWVIGACGAFPILTSPYPEQFTIIGVGNDESLANAVMVRPDSPLLNTKGANKGYPNLYGKADDVRGKTIICPASSSAQYLLTKWLAAYSLTTVTPETSMGLKSRPHRAPSTPRNPYCSWRTKILPLPTPARWPPSCGSTSGPSA